MKKKLPTVVVFGRTNVGKSTLFNKITGKSMALIADIEGTTRDSNMAEAEWNGIDFTLIDTGGITDLDFLLEKKAETGDIEAKVQKQASDYLAKADLVLFVVDAKAGILPQDKEMSGLLKKVLPKSKKIILVVNKSDSQKLRKNAASFYKLAMGEPMTVSATTGSGIGDLLDEVSRHLGEKFPLLKESSKKIKEEIIAEMDARKEALSNAVKVCFIGKPNVGKSSLINKMLGYERAIVSPVPHTTREPQDIEFNYKDKLVRLVDTAGLSRQGQKDHRRSRVPSKIKDVAALEKMSIEKSLYSLNKADIALFVMDVNEELTRQDAKIIEEIVIRKKSLVIVANKWDLIEEKDTKKFTESIYDFLPFATWAPIIFVSALTGNKVKKVLDVLLDVDRDRRIELSEQQLDRFLARVIKMHKPAKGTGTKHPHIYKIHQISANPPIVEVKIGSKDNLHFSYVRFLSNRLRERFGFVGTPISVKVLRNKKIHGAHDGNNSPRKRETRSRRPS
ncbi:MAG: ribosome biogenesis GTPase Der [Patescibacteria group bacterium]|jgi:GTP-binding protein|nr:ribosome biogenesis GTPase Der [Patescibacteria group bacterium]